MRIDVHTHFMPPRLMEKMHQFGGFEELDALQAIPLPMARMYAAAMFQDGEAGFVQRWIQDMDSRSVDLIVNSIPLQPTFSDKAKAVEAARFINELLGDAIGLGAGRIKAFGVTPLPHVEAAVAEIARCLDDRGFVGINLPCSVAGRPIDAPEFEPVWAALNERAATVYFHSGQTPVLGVGAEDWSLGQTFSSPVEIALVLCRLVLSKVVLKYPKVRVIGAGFGGALSYGFDRLVAHVQIMHGQRYGEVDGILPHLRKFWYDTGLEDPYVYDYMRRSIGVDRIVLGSDSPRIKISDTVDQILASEQLSAQEKRQILDHNGANALGLLAPVLV